MLIEKKCIFFIIYKLNYTTLPKWVFLETRVLISVDEGMHVTECVLLFFDKWDDEEDESAHFQKQLKCVRD